MYIFDIWSCCLDAVYNSVCWSNNPVQCCSQKDSCTSREQYWSYVCLAQKWGQGVMMMILMDKNNDDDDDDDAETKARICVAMQHHRSRHPALPLQTWSISVQGPPEQLLKNCKCCQYHSWSLWLMWLLLKFKNVIIFTRFHKSLGSVDLKGPDDCQKSG